MRGDADQRATMLTATTPDAKVPRDHPIRVDGDVVQAVESVQPWTNAPFL